ncbi:MAG: nucleotide sugar dehydrogenase [Phycisphaeraceae bacterium JB051]
MTLQQLITERKAKVGIIGLGYVGLPLMRAFFKAGYPVIGYDVDPAKIEKIHKGENYLKHLGEDFIAEMSQAESFDATADFDRLGEADALLLCVPTPLGKHLEPDLSYVEVTTEAIAKTLRKGQLVVLESTTYPGTTRQVMQPVLEKTGLKCGEDFYLAYSPEREDPGRKNFNTQTIPKLVGGIGDEAGKMALELYSAAVSKAIPVSSAEVAESAKLLENIYRSVNIALVNEMKVVLDAMDIDIWEVVDAAATKPFGFQAFYPGPGLGGHCIPIDPYYLTWKAREVGHTTRFIELAGEVNHSMPDYVVNKTMLALNKNKKAVAASKILVLGLAYKPNVDDIRESPSFEIIEKLQELGGDVYYNDPHVPATHKMREYDLQMESVELTTDTLKQYDCVVIATNHEAYDWQMIADNAKLVIDSRGALREVTGNRDHIVNA